MTKEKDTYKYEKLYCRNCEINRRLDVPKGMRVTDFLKKIDERDVCPNCDCKGELRFK